MPRNVEIKASVKDFEKFLSLAKELSGSEGTLLEQEDTFFNVPEGRLKLRFLKGRTSQLIFYQRPDSDGPKVSDFHCSDVSDQVKETLRLALGIKGSVAKKRWLFMVGQTRIHADVVDGLGSFMELEVMLRPEQTLEEGDKIAKDLMDKLQIDQSQLLSGAYMDMLLKKGLSA
ncbi:hypothetical protein CAPTEDRAFT_165045 [Capitella teleta]|uniref:CYTH domain-containing protein n=1 Tax=Capitella teleta TaxID=283909 RepID=R7TEJ7_CAPTE|nr:hypothetical protein CAPTEDRAFT_165045 [Capitella teleta]|eukprot:ELT91902.1 hypothetical protein CAPTEDRAFT_165045 [Capitella teleta]